MKKTKLLFFCAVMALFVLLFSQCEKDHTGIVHISCYYLSDDNDTIGPISGVWVEVDTIRLSPHLTMDTVITVNGDTMAIQRTNYCDESVRKAYGYTGTDGTITFQFPRSVLLTFNAADTLIDESGYISQIYRGKSEVLVKENTEVDCPIYLTPLR